MFMRAALVYEFDTAPVLGEMPEPVRSPGQCLVEIHAAALNPVDLLVATGTFYGGRPELPYVPGTEAAGVVIEGERLAPGTRVRVEIRSGSTRFGLMAERACVSEDDVDVLPDDLSDEVAAGLGVAGMAAWLSLEWRAKLSPGERVLVLGASGVVGRIAVQAARLMGAGRIVAAARSEGSFEELAGLGADATVALDANASPAEQAEAFRQAAGGPLDVVVDPLWGLPGAAALESLGLNGRLVNLGQSAGKEATLPSSSVRGRLLSILGHSNVVAPREVLHDAYAKLAHHAAKGEIHLECETLGLEDIGAAWARQARSPHHKLLVDPRR